MSCDTRGTDKLDMKGKRVYNNKQYLSLLCTSLIERNYSAICIHIYNIQLLRHCRRRLGLISLSQKREQKNLFTQTQLCCPRHPGNPIDKKTQWCVTKNYENMQRSQQLQRKPKIIILTSLTVNIEILKKIYNNLGKNVVYKLNCKILRRLIEHDISKTLISLAINMYSNTGITNYIKRNFRFGEHKLFTCRSDNFFSKLYQ